MPGLWQILHIVLHQDLKISKKTIEYMLLEWFFFSNHAGRHKTHYFYNKPAKQPALAEANFLFG